MGSIYVNLNSMHGALIKVIEKKTELEKQMALADMNITELITSKWTGEDAGQLASNWKLGLDESSHSAYTTCLQNMNRYIDFLNLVIEAYRAAQLEARECARKIIRMG